MSEENKNGWISNCGSIVTKKSGEGFYIKISKDLDLKQGDILSMIKLEDDVNNKVERGLITSEEAQAEIEKLHFVKYKLSRAPRK